MQKKLNTENGGFSLIFAFNYRDIMSLFVGCTKASELNTKEMQVPFITVVSQAINSVMVAILSNQEPLSWS